jgi:hypothetical protein
MIAAPLALLNQALTPVINLMAGRPVLATFQVNLRCNSSCGYCDLPLNVGRYEMTKEAPFVRRALFEQLGGFPNRLILEDVAFCEKLIKITKPLLLSPSVVADARKVLKMGVWRSFLRVLLIILHVEFRLPVLPRAFFHDVR